MTPELVILDDVRLSLEQAKSLHELVIVRAQAEAARKYAKGASLGLAAQNEAAELKLRAERKAGALLRQMHLRGGDRKNFSRSNSHRESLTLADLGLDHNASARWQREATVPDDVFERYIAEAQANGREITSQGVLRLARSGDYLAHGPVVGVRSPHFRVEQVDDYKTDVPPEKSAPKRVLRILTALQRKQRRLAKALQPVLAEDAIQPSLRKRATVRRLLREIEYQLALLLQVDRWEPRS